MAKAEQFETVRIPHLDGTGRATIVEIDPDVPGAREFLGAQPERVPEPGELIVPASPHPVSTPEAGAPD